MGAPPPTRIAPMDTCTEERRLMLMGMYGANSTVATLGRHSRGLLSYVSPNRSVRRESGASRNAEGANSARKRSGTGTADGGRCNLRGLLESGGAALFPPTEGERRLPSA